MFEPAQLDFHAVFTCVLIGIPKYSFFSFSFEIRFQCVDVACLELSV